MAPNSNSPTRLTPTPNSTTLVSNESRPLSTLLYYGCAVDIKLLVALSELGSTQAASTELSTTDLSQLLDYLSTYPDNGILYRSSAMILSAHSDAAYLNVSCAHSRAGALIMLSKNIPVPSLNGPVLTISQIIKTSCLPPLKPKSQASSSAPKPGYPSETLSWKWGGIKPPLPFSATTPPPMASSTRPW